MAPTVPLTSALISTALHPQTLADLLTDPNDLENDLHVLLNWLSPYYLMPGKQFAEPSARVRAASKRCLRDKNVHQEFIKLLLNSISLKFKEHFSQFIRTASFIAVVKHVESLYTFYSRQLMVLNVTPLAHDLFKRGITSFFLEFLQTPRVLSSLETYLNQHFHQRPQHSLRSLVNVGMGPHIQELIVQIATSKIFEYITINCSKVWDRPVLQDIQEWVRVDLYPIFALGGINPSTASSKSLVRIAHDELVSLRITEIYDIISFFPHSQASLQEISKCLKLDSASYITQTQHRSRLVESFTSQCESRLLHSGNDTIGIIVTYINTIKSFLIADPTGVLLDKVARPIRKYLRSRSDLVPVLVRGMLDTDHSSNRLYEMAHEIRSGKPPMTAPVDDLSDINWYPDPIDALPDFKRGKVSDVVDALTTIYQSSTVFVDEFTRLFGARLLQWNKYDTKEIVHNVSLLKSRFGAAEFTVLDVMIKDIEDSDSLNAAIKNERLRLTILSKMYWPTVVDSLSEKDYFDIPVTSEINSFCNAFKGIKRGRDVTVLPSLGTVTLELCFQDEICEYTVTPAQATVIQFFNDNFDEISIHKISLGTKMSVYTATQALKFWVDEQVLIASQDCYRIGRV